MPYSVINDGFMNIEVVYQFIFTIKLRKKSSEYNIKTSISNKIHYQRVNNFYITVP